MRTILEDGVVGGGLGVLRGHCEGERGVPRGGLILMQLVLSRSALDHLWY
jgi:hypothetical protein